MSIVEQNTFAADVRTTEDGKKSVLDLLRQQGVSNPSQCLKRIQVQYPEVLTTCDNFQFPGAGQRKTPVVDRDGWFQILGLLPTVAGVKYRKAAATVMGKLQDGDAELGAELIIRDHNKERVERAKKRLLVTDTNRQVAALATAHGVNPGMLHNDRYRGLYRRTAKQLRIEAGIGEKETPLDVLSARDNGMNWLANQMAIEAENPDLVFDFANDIRESYGRRVGKELTPIFEEKRIRPSQAQKIAYAPEYQIEMPI